MKKWIALITCVTCTFSSFTYADAAPPAEEHLAISPELAEVAEDAMPETPTQVGAAAQEGSATGSGAGKYVLAAAAIIVAVAALILVARHDGHHHHKH